MLKSNALHLTLNGVEGETKLRVVVDFSYALLELLLEVQVNWCFIHVLLRTSDNIIAGHNAPLRACL